MKYSNEFKKEALKAVRRNRREEGSVTVGSAVLHAG